MFNIADYFKKFSKIEGDSQVLRDSISQSIFETCGIDKVSFQVKKGIIYIQASGMVKSLIYTKKSQILSLLKTKAQNQHITDIR